MGDSKISGKKTGERFCASRGQFIDLFDNVFSLPHMVSMRVVSALYPLPSMETIEDFSG